MIKEQTDEVETEEYTDEATHRYIFTVRQRFGECPDIDCFHELKVPSGLTGDHAKIMKRLKDDFCKEEIGADTAALHGMELRLRFNPDMYQKVCLVRTTMEITPDELSAVIASKHRENKLKAFLDEAQ